MFSSLGLRGSGFRAYGFGLYSGFLVASIIPKARRVLKRAAATVWEGGS